MSAQDGDTTATLCSPAAPPLEDDDLLSEILLRLPPLPSSLPRASAVCKRWLGLVSDPRFFRRFGLRHRRNPPVLGFFRDGIDGLHFRPTMNPPNRVPHYRFSSPIEDRDSFRLLGCRHGLALVLDTSRDQFLVWDPVTGDQHRTATPPGFDMEETPIDGAVLPAAGDPHHFQVVLVGYKQEQSPQAILCIYSSETCLWSNLITTPVPREALDVDYEGVPAVLAGNTLYWQSSSVIVEVDLCRQSIDVTQVPTHMFAKGQYCNQFMVIRAEGGSLGLLSLSDYTVQLWKRNTDCEGVASWVLRRTFELDKLLPLDPQIESTWLLGYAEENNVVLLKTFAAIYMVQLDSLQIINKLIDNNNSVVCYPFESVYAAETDIGGGYEGADQDILA